MTGFAQRAWYDGLLYASNRLITRCPSHTLRLAFYRSVMGFDIGPGSHIFMDAWFDSKGRFSMGRNSVINQRCRMDNRGGIVIADNVSISADVVVLTADHDVHRPDAAGRERMVRLENYVFVGTRAMVLPGVTIGEGAVVAAGSVVTKSVEPYAIVAGVPARQIGERPRGLDYSASYCRLFA